jgi:hypothetical protein
MPRVITLSKKIIGRGASATGRYAEIEDEQRHRTCENTVVERCQAFQASTGNTVVASGIEPSPAGCGNNGKTHFEGGVERRKSWRFWREQVPDGSRPIE